MIHISTCQFQYDKKSVLDIDSLHIKEGEHIFLHGKSGSAKSTFLNLLCGILEPTHGDIEVFGTKLSSLSLSQKDKFRADNFGVIFQQFNLLPYLSVEENILLACGFTKSKKISKEEIKILLDALELSVDCKTAAMKLSVGQQQRVAVARALINRPKIILADEPTSALDSDAKERFMKLLFTQASACGATLVFVSHDKSLASHFDTVYDFSTLNRAFV
ncbi:MAG: ABC transporter ATP-binding protein [Campylobacterales bacterium]|nr:ABC transporter ATP-binding protein [Campylobacterales bacterium]